MTTTENPTTTDPEALTAEQASLLNKIACANDDLLRAARALRSRAEAIEGAILQGEHLGGFASDVLGQPGRDVQHYASVRDALVSTARPVSSAMLAAALSPHACWFVAGQTDPEVV